MSMHGITGPPDQSSQSSGNNVSGHTPNPANFRRALTKSVLSKLVLSEKWTKVQKKSLKMCYAPMPVMPNFIALRETKYEKSTTKFVYTLQDFCAPGGLPGPQFTNLGTAVQQGPDYHCAKFCPLLTTCLRDICCRTMLISVKEWSTDKNPANDVSAYHATTTSQHIRLHYIFYCNSSEYYHCHMSRTYSASKCIQHNAITPWVKKGCHPNHGKSFVNSWSICKILSLLQRALNF